MYSVLTRCVMCLTVFVGFHHYTTRIQGSDSHDHRSGHIHDEFGPCVHISMVRSDIEKAEVYVATSHEPHFPSIPSDTNYDFTCEVEYPYNYTLLSIEVYFGCEVVSKNWLKWESSNSTHRITRLYGMRAVHTTEVRIANYVPLFCETRWLGMSGETEHVFAVLDIIHANCEPVSYPSWRNYLARFSLPEIHDSDAYLEFCIRESAAAPKVYCEGDPDPCELRGLDCYRSGECDYETGICSCANLFGFTGEVCEDHECMCLNEGKCEPDNSGSTVCRCPIGFGGLACEIPDKCVPNPCHNSAFEMCSLIQDRDTFDCQARELIQSQKDTGLHCHQTSDCSSFHDSICDNKLCICPRGKVLSKNKLLVPDGKSGACIVDYVECNTVLDCTVLFAGHGNHRCERIGNTTRWICLCTDANLRDKTTGLCADYSDVAENKGIQVNLNRWHWVLICVGVGVLCILFIIWIAQHKWAYDSAGVYKLQATESMRVDYAIGLAKSAAVQDLDMLRQFRGRIIHGLKRRADLARENAPSRGPSATKATDRDNNYLTPSITGLNSRDEEKSKRKSREKLKVPPVRTLPKNTEVGLKISSIVMRPASTTKLEGRKSRVVMPRKPRSTIYIPASSARSKKWKSELNPIRVERLRPSGPTASSTKCEKQGAQPNKAMAEKSESKAHALTSSTKSEEQKSQSHKVCIEKSQSKPPIPTSEADNSAERIQSLVGDVNAIVTKQRPETSGNTREKAKKQSKNSKKIPKLGVGKEKTTKPDASRKTHHHHVPKGNINKDKPKVLKQQLSAASYEKAVEEAANRNPLRSGWGSTVRAMRVITKTKQSPKHT